MTIFINDLVVYFTKSDCNNTLYNCLSIFNNLLCDNL